jgi:hypothetical protein
MVSRIPWSSSQIRAVFVAGVIVTGFAFYQASRRVPDTLIALCAVFPGPWRVRPTRASVLQPLIDTPRRSRQDRSVVALWIVAGLALLLALAALSSARRSARKLEALNQSYWELRYDYTRLRSQVARLDPEQAETPAEPTAPAAPPAVSFVPLSSITKKR